MKNLKDNKGITLVALIITIIVLLILAVVAISAVQGDGIIAHAKNARDNYETAQETENTALAGYLTQIENANNDSNTNDNNKSGSYIYYRWGDYPNIMYWSDSDSAESTIQEFYDAEEIEGAVFIKQITQKPTTPIEYDNIIIDDLEYGYISYSVYEGLTKVSTTYGWEVATKSVSSNTNIVIPSQIEGYDVIKLPKTFRNCSLYVTSITLPNTLATIDLDVLGVEYPNLTEINYNGFTYSNFTEMKTANPSLFK